MILKNPKTIKFLKKLSGTIALISISFLVGYFFKPTHDGRIAEKDTKPFSNQFHYAILPDRQVSDLIHHHSVISYSDVSNLCFHANNPDDSLLTQSIAIQDVGLTYHVTLHFSPNSSLLSIQQNYDKFFNFSRTINLSALLKISQLIKKTGKQFELSLNKENLVILVPFLTNDPFMKSILIVKNLNGKIDDNGDTKIDLIVLTLIVDFFGAYQLPDYVSTMKTQS
ncbi:MAG: hypothetical protein AB2989_01525 [Candidatus Symbiodolus clandestinus]